MEFSTKLTDYMIEDHKRVESILKEFIQSYHNKDVNLMEHFREFK